MADQDRASLGAGCDSPASRQFVGGAGGSKEHVTSSNHVCAIVGHNAGGTTRRTAVPDDKVDASDLAVRVGAWTG